MVRSERVSLALGRGPPPHWARLDDRAPRRSRAVCDSSYCQCAITASGQSHEIGEGACATRWPS
eukprot:15353632-Alexandrium_andersonii.AAC.1